MIFGTLALVLSILGIVPYLYKVWFGSVRPERGSWFVWSVILALSIWGYEKLGADESLLLLVGDFVATFLVFLSSIFKGRGFLSRFNVECLCIAAVGILMWQFTTELWLVLAGTLVADMMGVIMTLRSTLETPHNESASPFLFASLASVLGFLAVATWDLQLMFYPFYLFLANFSTALVILVGHYYENKYQISNNQQSGAV